MGTAPRRDAAGAARPSRTLGGLTARVAQVGDGKQMPQHGHAMMTTEQLDVLTVAGHLRLDGLEQQRLGDVPCSGHFVYALHGIERNPAPHSILGL